MVSLIIHPSIVCGIQRVELSMRTSRPDALIPKPLPEIVPVEPFVGHDGFQIPEISRKDLPGDLSVVRQAHRAVDIENRTGVTVDECGGFHRFVGVADTFGVIATADAIRQTGGVDRLNLSEIK